MKVFNHTAHKALWNWLSMHPRETKSCWPAWDFNGGKVKEVEHNCFACEYAMGVFLQQPICVNCPLDFGCHCADGIYGTWGGALMEEAAQLAAKIRDLPVREGVVCK